MLRLPAQPKSTNIIYMNKFAVNLCLAFAVLLGSEVNGSELPRCLLKKIQHNNNCFGLFYISDGAKYYGEVGLGKRHGQGTLTYANGIKFSGEFRDGIVLGQGTLTYPNGDKYVGEFRDGKQHGQGTYIWNPPSNAVGDKYVGEWKDGVQHGQGTYTKSNGNKYVGGFRACLSS